MIGAVGMFGRKRRQERRDHVKSQAVTDGVLDGGLILGDPYRGVGEGLPQNGFDDLSQRSGEQNAWPVLH
jgi:hypothetical protein